MKYIIELTEKQANQLNDIMIGINASWGYASAPKLKIDIPMKESYAYKKGYEDGKKEPREVTNVEDTNEYQIGYKTGYDKGYYDGYDKCLHSSANDDYEKGKLDGLEEFENLFINEYDYEQFFKDTYGTKDPDYNLYDLVAKYGAKKVVDDFKKWEEEKKKAKDAFIKVGDEVIFRDSGIKGIATRVVENDARIFFSDGSGEVFLLNADELHKTGRNFSNEVAQLLDKLRGKE